jgi:hypothetical protein
VYLKSGGGQLVRLSHAAALVSATLRDMLETLGPEPPGTEPEAAAVPVAAIDTETLRKVALYCEQRAPLRALYDAKRGAAERALADLTGRGEAAELPELPELPAVRMELELEVERYSGDPFRASEHTQAFDAGWTPGLEAGDASLAPELQLRLLLLAADFLDIRSMLDLVARQLARGVAGKTPREIREWLGLAEDFTAQEEEANRSEQLERSRPNLRVMAGDV